MKIKTSLVIGVFSAALFMAGCTAAPAQGPPGPQGQPGATGQTGDPGQDADRRRADDQKRLDEEKRAGDQKQADDQRRGDDQRRADDKVKERQDAGCAAGEHVFTNADGRKSCVKD
jgi:hypothetical protein